MKPILCALLLSAPMFCHGNEILTIELTCDKTDYVIQTLRKDFKEVPILLGQANDEAGSVMSLWIGPDKSWTIVATKDDTSCIVGSGNQLQPVPRGKKDKNFY